MCVAVVVESLKRIANSDIEAMAKANPHGGGVAWINGDDVQYRKGMSWEEIAWIQDHLPRPYLMHFRIATRGGKIPELTHPFPIGMSAFSGDLTGFCSAAIIHNGTWSGYMQHVPTGIDGQLVSDTQTAAYMAEANEQILESVGWSNAILRAAGRNRASVTLRGSWTSHEGNMFSNMIWHNRQTSYRHYATTPPTGVHALSAGKSLVSVPGDKTPTPMSEKQKAFFEEGRDKPTSGATNTPPPTRTVISGKERKLATKQAKRERRESRLRKKGESVDETEAEIELDLGDLEVDVSGLIEGGIVPPDMMLDPDRTAVESAIRRMGVKITPTEADVELEGFDPWDMT